MGQRHQIYLHFAGIDRKFHQKTGKFVDKMGERHTVGIHHQWLYGSGAIRRLQQFLSFVEKTAADKYNVWQRDISWGKDGQYESQMALQALYNIDLESGHVHPTHLLDAENVWDAKAIADPREGDNNDGITIIDLTVPTAPKYAFLFFHPHGDAEYGVTPAPALRPLTARQYLASYYKEIGADPEKYRRAPEGSWAAADALDGKYKLLTPAAVRKIFPAMFKKQTPSGGGARGRGLRRRRRERGG